MNRKLIKQLNTWIKKRNRKPLILRGARQVGKSTLVRIFSEKSGLDLIEINLEKHRELDSVFSSLNVEDILLSLETIAGKRATSGSLLFLDEIQATPNALAALRYFYEEKPEIPLIAAGSLLEFTLADHSFSMPVGRIEYLSVGTMTFEEYLEATDSYLWEVYQNLNLEKPINPTVHGQLLEKQRQYMMVGGMPEAVKTMADGGEIEDVIEIQNSICSTYLDDFSKYAKQSELKDLQIVFRSIPGIIGNKLKYTHLLPDSKSAYTRNLIELLIKARVASAVYRSDCSGIPLSVGVSLKFSKLLFLDVGLVSRLLGLDWFDIKTMDERTLINEGALAEQFIGQHLLSETQTLNLPELYYWAHESPKRNAEIDFATATGSMIVPIEVKSGKSGTLKSLHYFIGQKKLQLAIRFDLNHPSSQMIETKTPSGENMIDVRYKLLSLPLYMVGKLGEIIASEREARTFD